MLFYLADTVTDLSPRDKKGFTPLMHAVKCNCSPAVKYLLQKGADPNLTDEHGITALLLAMQNESVGMCEMLLINGASPHIAEKERGITPLHIAAHK